MGDILNFVTQNKITLFFAIFIIITAQLILIMNIKRKGKEDKTIEEIFSKKLPNNLVAPIYRIIAVITALISAMLAFLS